MKERIILFLILILIAIPLVKALPACSDGSAPDEDLDEVVTGKISGLNGLGIGLIESDEIFVFNRFTADIILDAQSASLSNETPELNLNFKDESDVTVKLVNASDDSAKITVKSSSKEIPEGEHDTVGSYEVMVVSAQGTDTSNMEASFIVGQLFIAFSNDENPSTIETFGDTDYLIELVSASESNAIFRVSTCETGAIELKEEPEPEPEVNETQQNETQTNETAQNETVTENPNEPEPECLLVGGRTGTEYCDENNTLVQQKQPGEVCENNYECTQNECDSGECKKPGFFARIAEWFKNLFN